MELIPLFAIIILFLYTLRITTRNHFNWARDHARLCCAYYEQFEFLSHLISISLLQLNLLIIKSANYSYIKTAYQLNFHRAPLKRQLDIRNCRACVKVPMHTCASKTTDSARRSLWSHLLEWALHKASSISPFSSCYIYTAIREIIFARIWILKFVAFFWLSTTKIGFSNVYYTSYMVYTRKDVISLSEHIHKLSL